MSTKKADVNNPVFTHIAKGLYEARVLGYVVRFTRMDYDHWEARVEGGPDHNKLLATDKMMRKALIEAHYNIIRENEERYGWVLEDKPLRQYGERGEYNTDIRLSVENDIKQIQRVSKKKDDQYWKVTSPKLRLVEDEDDVQEPMSGSLRETLTVEQRLRIKKFYKVRPDKMRGGFSLIKYDHRGILDHIEGPFETAGKAYEKAIELEGFTVES